MDPGRNQNQSQHSPEAQLQADALGGIGIPEQDHQQRRGQRGGRVGVPEKQRGQQQEKLHDARPHHRRRQAHHEHIHRQHGDAHCRQKPPPLGPHQERKQRQQKGAVQARHGKQVAHPRLGKPGGEGGVYAGPIPQKLRPEDSGCGFVRPDPADRIAHCPGQVLGQIPHRSGASRGDIGKCIAVQQNKNAPGGEGG